MADEQQSTLKVLVQLVDQVTAPLRSINNSFEEFSESVHGILTSGAEVFAGYEAIKGLVDPAMDMAEAQTHLALASGYGAEQLAHMKEQAEQLSEVLPKSMEDITAAQEEMVKTLGAGGNIDDAVRMSTKLSTVLGVDATMGANALAGAYEQLGDKSKPVIDQMGIIADKLTILKDLYMKPGEAQSLERDIQRIGKSAQAAGISQNQMFAIWAEGNKLHAGGPRGFGMVEASLFDTLAKSSKELQKAGLRVFHFPDTGGVNMIATLEAINKLTDKGKMKLFAELPGQAKVLVEMASHLDDIRESMDKFRNSGGALQSASDMLGNTPDANVEKFKHSLHNLGDTIGTTMLPQLTKLVDKLTEFAKEVNIFLGQHPAIAKAIGDIALGIAALLTLGGAYGFLKIIGNVILLAWRLAGIPVLLEMIGNAWAAMALVVELGSEAMGAAMLMAFESNPVGWIITGLLLIALLSYEIYKHWDEIGAAIRDAVDAVKEFAHFASPKDWAEVIGGNLIGNHAMVAAGMIDAFTSPAALHYESHVTVHAGAGADAPAIGQAVSGVLHDHADELNVFLANQQHDSARRSFGDTTTPGHR